MVARTKVVATEGPQMVRFWIHFEGRANITYQWIKLQDVWPWQLEEWSWHSKGKGWEQIETRVSRRAVWEILSLMCL